MQRKTHSELLEELHSKEEKLKQRIASVEARHRTAEEKVTTRKKILIGAHVLHEVENDPSKMQALLNELDHFLCRPHDRKLFDLPLRE